MQQKLWPYLFKKTYDIRVDYDQFGRINCVKLYQTNFTEIEDYLVLRGVLMAEQLILKSIEKGFRLSELAGKLPVGDDFEAERKIINTIAAFDELELSKFRWELAEKMAVPA